jgi:hypothetical protein
MAWWALGFVVQQAVLAVGAVRRGEARARLIPSVAQLAASATLWAIVAVTLTGTLWTLRRYQQTRVAQLFNGYVAFAKEPLDRTPTPIADDKVLIDSPARTDVVRRALQGDGVHTEYVVAEFSAADCDELKLDLTFRYVSTEPAFDFSRSVQVRPPLDGADVTRVFFPAFFHRGRSDQRIQGGYGLKGIELPASAASCLSGLYRVRDVSGVALLLNAYLPPGWEQATPYQTIDGWEHRRNAQEQLDIYAYPPDWPVTRNVITRPVTALGSDEIAKRSKTLTVGAEGWRVNGIGGVGGEGRFLYLAELHPREMKKGAVLIAQGRIDDGGISIGLVQAGRWIVQVPIVKVGNFVTVINVPADGPYAVVIANNLPGPSLRNDLIIRKIGWALGS